MKRMFIILYDCAGFSPSDRVVDVRPEGRWTWTAGVTPAGRFCNAFGFKDGKIARLRIYLDPDYGGDDKGRFLWG